jgi:hypothetical protein
MVYFMEWRSIAEIMLRLTRPDSSIDSPRLFSENGAFWMLNDCSEDQGFALKQRATETLTTAFEETPKTDGMELVRAGFVRRLAAVCQAMEDLAGVAEMANSVLEWAEPWALAKGESW